MNSQEVAAQLASIAGLMANLAKQISAEPAKETSSLASSQVNNKLETPQNDSPPQTGTLTQSAPKSSPQAQETRLAAKSGIPQTPKNTPRDVPGQQVFDLCKTTEEKNKSSKEMRSNLREDLGISNNTLSFITSYYECDACKNSNYEIIFKEANFYEGPWPQKVIAICQECGDKSEIEVSEEEVNKIVIKHKTSITPKPEEESQETQRKVVPEGKARTFITKEYECDCGKDELQVTFFDSTGVTMIDSKCLSCGKEERFNASEAEIDKILKSSKEVLPKKVMSISLGDSEVEKVQILQVEILKEEPKKRGRPKKTILAKEALPEKGTIKRELVDGEEVVKFIPKGKEHEIELTSEQETKVQATVNELAPALDLTTARKELEEIVYNYSKEQIIKKYEALTCKPFSEELDYDSVVAEIVNSLLGVAGSSDA